MHGILASERKLQMMPTDSGVFSRRDLIKTMGVGGTAWMLAQASFARGEAPERPPATTLVQDDESENPLIELHKDSEDEKRMESFFSSLKTERPAAKIYRTRAQAKADGFDYIEGFYNPRRRHSTLGYLSPMEFEMKAELA